MRRRILTFVLVSLCLLPFSCYIVFGAGAEDYSVPDGFTETVAYRKLVVSSNYGYSFGDSPLPSPVLSDVLVTKPNLSLTKFLLSMYPSFDLLGYVNVPDYTKSGSIYFDFTYPSGYSDLFIVVPVYYIYSNSESLFLSSMSSTAFTKGFTTPASEGLSWSTVYPGGPSVSVRYMIYYVTDPSFRLVLNYYYRPDYFSSPYNISLPVIEPIAFTTSEAANEYIRDSLAGIQDSLGDVNSNIEGTNSRLDELEEGLFSTPDGWEEYVSSVWSGIDEQSRLESSVDEVANSFIGAGFEDLSFDPGAVSSDLMDALGSDPGGSSFVRFFQWLWSWNPMLPVEVGIVFAFFVVGLVIRTYA